MKEIRKYFKLSFTTDIAYFYEAEDGELIAYRDGFISKINMFSVGENLRLIRSLYLDKNIAYVNGNKSKICVVRKV